LWERNYVHTVELGIINDYLQPGEEILLSDQEMWEKIHDVLFRVTGLQVDGCFRVGGDST
jgi:hypothetical protein